MGERRDKLEGTSYNLETGEVTEGHVWPDRCGWYQGAPTTATGLLGEVLGEGTVVPTGEDLVCTFHAAQGLGISEDKLARLGLVRDEFFNVHSIESLTADGDVSVNRDPVSCQQPWIGRCLWDMGYLVLWVNSPENVNKMLAGDDIEGSLSEEDEEQIQVWMP